MTTSGCSKAEGIAQAFLLLTVTLSIPLGITYVREENSGESENWGLYMAAWALFLTWYCGTCVTFIAAAIAASESKRATPLLFVSLTMFVVPPIVACFF